MAVRKKKWVRWTAIAIVVLCGGVWWYAGDAIVTAVKLIASGKVDLTKTPKKTYTADRRENLKAIHVALSLYEESEGQFPEAGGWMDAIKPMLRPSDMKEGEEIKKLKNPAVTGGLSDAEFGYSLNQSASAKPKSAIKDPKAVLVFESPRDLKANAHGKDERKPGELAITIAGEIVERK